MEKIRYLALTDIFDGFEVDDIQSMIRLLLYSDELEIEGLICATSCFVKGDTPRREGLIRAVIDAYARVLPNLKVHAEGWPTAEYLHSVACSGIDEFGKRPGRGFAHARYAGNAGVRRIIEAVDRPDARPLYIGLWAGANTLAQAVWQVARERTPAQLDEFLSKMRIYGISDQDHASRWLRENYGDRLFWIVSPTKGSWFGNLDYWRATWPGISSDRAKHGSEDGVHRTKGFTGADYGCICEDWLQKNIISKGPLGALYPLPKYITEGDTPTFLWLIRNGLNDPEHPGYGGWGGRYEFCLPAKKQFGVREKFPIWTNASDTVTGTDCREHTSPQATIWRWRTHFQNDFAARMDWTVQAAYEGACHPPRVFAEGVRRTARPGEEVCLRVRAEDADGKVCTCRWFVYPEAGTCRQEVRLQAQGEEAGFVMPAANDGETVHVIAAVTGGGSIPLTRYARFIIEAQR